MGKHKHFPFVFEPQVLDWLARTFERPTPAQESAWPEISAGRDVLVAAPTGSGKTLCAFLSAINDLVKQAQKGQLAEATYILYISPLKALSRDIDYNLQAPLRGIYEQGPQSASVSPTQTTNKSNTAPLCPLTTAVRTGDTKASERAQQVKHPAHIFATTPESLYILLTSESGRRMLSQVRTVIVDEIHAVIGDKRGAHLALSLERLTRLVQENGGQRPQRIGLSATQKPIELVAEFLTGVEPANKKGRPCSIVNVGHQRQMDLSLCLPGSPLEAVMSAECWTEVYDQLAHLVKTHKTTLIFTNTRRLAERITRFLSERLEEGSVTSHHGSMASERRHAAESALKEGKLRALVATASLELGIDVGDVDLVCQISSPGSIATFLQRVGRSGHFVSGIPKGRLFPLSRDDLVECVALLDAISRGELDEVELPEAPLDILAQQMVASVVPHELPHAELYDLCRRATPYRELSLDSFNEVLSMLASGFATARGRRGAYLHHDAVGQRIKARKNARLTAITNGGAIVDNFDFEVVLAPSEIKVGTVHEDFAIESSPGDVFQLGNTSYQIIKVDPGKVRVVDAQGAPPSLPFWLGEAPSRSDELSYAVARLRQRVADCDEVPELEKLSQNISQQLTIPLSASRNMVEYLKSAQLALGAMPTQKHLVAERFFDEAGGMHVVIHSVFGSRTNRAFGLALRKRFCRSFNVELQAAATEDAIVLSLGPMHSFPLFDVFGFLHSGSIETVLIQALLDAPLFATRWRWNASRALAVLRFRGGKKTPPRFQRIDSDDLLAVCFPDQVACLENISGPRKVPDHPLVQQTIRDCLDEAMDLKQLRSLLDGIENKQVSLSAYDLTEASPLSHEILNARPYAFLDDAPLEERRTQAVQMRRFAELSSAQDLGALSPDAIEQVVADNWPQPRDADELHDALLVFGALREDEMKWPHFAEQLQAAGRLFRCRQQGHELYFAYERRALFLSAYANADFSPQRPPLVGTLPDAHDALLEICRSRLELSGPTTASELAERLLVPRQETEAVLLRIENEGFALRGSFRPNCSEHEYCERRLLARIHRLTLNALRREIEPVSQSVFIDFLTHHQGLQAETRFRGPQGTLAALEQLSGFAAGASAWEETILPARIEGYESHFLDQLCLAGQVAWMAPLKVGSSRSKLSKNTPLRIVPRSEQRLWLNHLNAADEQGSTPLELGADARRVLDVFEHRGALFLDDLTAESRLLPSQSEAAVSELIAAGLITCDGFAAVRTLLAPSHQRSAQQRRRRTRNAGHSLQTSGRFSLLPSAQERTTQGFEPDPHLEEVAKKLLARWGVVFRQLLERENLQLSWGELRRVYHRLEARGEIRGGRFVHHFSGEQFATNEALQLLRQVRRAAPSQRLIRVSGCDPLNIVGILTPGKRLPSLLSNQLLILGGNIVARQEGGELQLTNPEDTESSKQYAAALRAPYARQLASTNHAPS